jgi:hypothetical protein
MMGDGGITAVALSAFFGLCVPGVSGGRIEQTVPTQSLLPLTSDERVQFAGAIDGEDAAFRFKSDLGLILVTTKDGACHVMTANGDIQSARDSFRSMLLANGGTETPLLPANTDPMALDGVIWTNKPHDAVVVGFSSSNSGNSGFYAYAFGIHKD